MKDKFRVLMFLILITFIFGCIESDINNIEQLTPQINDHMMKGDDYYNQAAEELNNFRTENAIENSNLATNEFNLARSSASEALVYAQNSQDDVLIKYLDLTILEIDAKLNATSELRSAAQFFQARRIDAGNQNLVLANQLMQEALTYQEQKEALVNQNPDKFKGFS